MSKKRSRGNRNAVVNAVDPRGVLAVQAQYDAARQGRRFAGWNPPSSGPNRAVAGLQTIRNRARDAARNEWAASSALRTLVTDLVGTGIVARPKTKSPALKAKFNKLWNDWTRFADADGVDDFYGLQILAARNYTEVGEVFVRLRPRRLSDGLDVPMQVQVIEAECVPLLDRDLPGGNRIVQGIEIDRIGRRVAFWMYREHPGDIQSIINTDLLVRVPADQVIHLFERKRPGQMRGVPDIAPALIKMKTIGDYDDATVENNKLRNLVTGFITRPEPVAGAIATDPLTGQAIGYDSNDNPMVSMEPGGMVELAPGEHVEFSSPPTVGVGYNDFMRQQYLSISAAMGVPYESLTGDIANISDRTLRAQIQQYRRNIEQRQWGKFIPTFCQGIRDAWVDAAVMSGAIEMYEADDARNVEWTPNAWAYIHPVQDAQSKIMEIDAGITSRSSVISSRGYDPEDVDAERAADMKREKKLGIVEPLPDPTVLTPQQKDKASKAKAETELLVAQANAALRVADAEVFRAKAYSDAQTAQAAHAQAEAKYSAARTDQAISESLVAEATLAQIKANVVLAEAGAAHAQALLAGESEARIAACKEASELARNESNLREMAMREANEFAAEQRALVLAADASRAEAARLEVEAANIGLAELRGE